MPSATLQLPEIREHQTPETLESGRFVELSQDINGPYQRKMEDFSSHQLHPLLEGNLQLYHVYDEISQTPYRPGAGIEAGDKNTYYIRYQHRITPRLIAKHLDWYQKEPTSFISLFDDPSDAFHEARRRMDNPEVYLDGESCHRSAVSVAIISARRLVDAGVFFFSTKDLTSERMLGGRIQHLAGKLNAREWFAMDYIPEAAVVRVASEDDILAGIV
ncbi:hypothetical protein B0I37DRAFT_382039 [Chaetomium sp. MPI-CAGE-AT-0009]|nr:hypothetical protein B0I37DRAFT_382039 [Chaetomium sp. MPI-CAGE-AT-0009]